MAQLLRLLIICGSEIQELMKNSSFVNNAIEKVHIRLLDFYIAEAGLTI
jgi:hypothetical protein